MKTRRWFTWSNWLQHVGFEHVETKTGLYFNDYGLAVQAAVAGQGLVLASWPILRDTFDAGLLSAPFENYVTTNIGYDVVTTLNAYNRSEIRSFIDWLVHTSNEEKSAHSSAGFLQK